MKPPRTRRSTSVVQAAVWLAGLGSGCRSGVSSGVDAATPTGGSNTVDQRAPQAEPAGDAAPMQLVPDAGKGKDAARPPGADGGTPEEFLGASRCNQGQYLLCDDFEGDTSKWTWTANGGGPSFGVVTGDIETGRFARGRKSFHMKLASPLTTPQNYTLFGTLASKMAFPVAGSHLFIRVFVFLESNTPNHHLFLLRANSTVKAPTGFDWYYQIQASNIMPPIGSELLYWHEWGYEGEVYPATKLSTYPAKVPLGRWACWEWELKGATDEIDLSVDEKPVAGMHIPSTRKWLAPAEVTVNLQLGEGIGFFKDEYSVWYDEVAVDKERIGCVR